MSEQTPPPGAPASPSPAPYQPPPRVRHEKDEGEKEEEKRQEKDEKEHDEKARRDPLSAIVWALILIWAGAVLLAFNLNLMPVIPGVRMTEWSWIFTGAGAIILLEVVIRLIMPEHRRGIIGSLIVAFIFLGIGLGGTVGWGLLWGLLLVGIGAVMLLGGAFRR